MAQKLRLKVSETLLKRTKGYALFNGFDVESVFNEAFCNWTDQHLDAPDVKRVNAVIPVAEIPLNNVREVAKKQGISLVRAVETALEQYLGERKPGAEGSPVSSSDATDVKSDAADAESVVADTRECTCTACGHTWTPKGKGQPAYCPRCRSKEWDKVTMCETDCGRPIAPLNTKAGSSTMCEPCYAEMNASWGELSE